MKRAEGIVTLIVCNPNKKDEKKEEKKEEISKTPKLEKKGKFQCVGIAGVRCVKLPQL